METPILHVDMDAFFASIEKSDNAKLMDLPVIVGTHPKKSTRGVVSTCCYIARKYGVKSAMSTVQALILCPEAVFIEPNLLKYAEVSKKVMECFFSFTPQVEPVSIDEAFLDISGCENLFGSPMEIAKSLRKEIYKKTSLTCSVGIAPNKFLAKLASDLNKPNGITLITKDNIEQILDPLPVHKIWGVGKKQKEKLFSIGIKTIADLKRLEKAHLETLFGVLGANLYNLSRGIDYRKVETAQETKSISNEITFSEDIIEESIIKSYLLKLSDKVSRRLRKHCLIGKTIHLKIKYNDFETVTSQASVSDPTSLPSEIFRSVWNLYLKRQLKAKKIRLIGVGVSNLYPDNYTQQLSLFTDSKKKERENKLLNSLDSILEKYGEKAICRGSEKIITRRDDDGSLV